MAKIEETPYFHKVEKCQYLDSILDNRIVNSIVENLKNKGFRKFCENTFQKRVSERNDERTLKRGSCCKNRYPGRLLWYLKGERQFTITHSGFSFSNNNMDCVEGMGQLKSPFVNLTVTSPPYNIGKEYEKKLPLQEYLDWCEIWIDKVHKITMWDGAFWFNLGYMPIHRKAKAMPIPYLLWNRIPFFLIQEVVWNYGAGVAGRKFFCFDSEGSVYPCEIWLEKLGNLRLKDYDLKKVRRDPQTKEMQSKIKDSKCYCQWPCAVATNGYFNLLFYLRIFGRMLRF